MNQNSNTTKRLSLGGQWATPRSMRVGDVFAGDEGNPAVVVRVNDCSAVVRPLARVAVTITTIHGERVSFTRPDKQYRISPNSTVARLARLGENWEDYARRGDLPDAVRAAFKQGNHQIKSESTNMKTKKDHTTTSTTTTTSSSAAIKPKRKSKCAFIDALYTGATPMKRTAMLKKVMAEFPDSDETATARTIMIRVSHIRSKGLVPTWLKETGEVAGNEASRTAAAKKQSPAKKPAPGAKAKAPAKKKAPAKAKASANPEAAAKKKVTKKTAAATK